MKNLIGYCGIDCEKCDAYIATMNNDQVLREKTAKLWAELNNAPILPEHINCEGCRMNGAKTVFCECMCEIRKCALNKGVSTCGDCSELKHCSTVGAIHKNNPEALDNLQRYKMKEENMDYIIREMRKAEYPVLKDFLYEAIYIPEGISPPDREVVNLPELQVYIAGFGDRKDDLCLIAEVRGRTVGAVWVRMMNDYGHVDEKTPSLAMSLYKEYRKMGIGTDLLITMLKQLESRGYEKVSLSVQKSNYAVSMYRKAGFEVIDENEEEYVMICRLCKR